MRNFIYIFLASINVISCVTVPAPSDKQTARCEISTNRLTLKVVDLAEATDSYYSLEGLIASPILVPTTAILSGAYVLAHNTYRLGEEKIVCG
ncbi:hypothetical protein [Microbulbifer sp. THAF38]|uniref:hypothetical protein n=1 Tax=Microbulbifer sp. THAF38 TaxID=2587856 RepID=UPI0012690FD7|nr:hypothetical protein [Microbulbifer sp. THAF38]QFT53771.1 hypothetical protein FIU95_04180 [Microbulbifer sp. THAF38]